MKGKAPSRVRSGRGNSPVSALRPAVSELLDMEEAIALLKTTRPTFYRWLRAGRLKGTKLGRQWRFRRHDVERFLAGQAPEVDLPTDISPLLGVLRSRLGSFKPAREIMRGNGVAEAVSLMIQLAAQMRASELHLEPQPQGAAALRFRLDGILQPIAEFDLRLLPPIVRHWKSLAVCNVNETAKPQEGRILINTSAAPGLDLRAIFLPAILGETVSARVLNAGNAWIKLDQLDYSEADRQRLRHWLDSPWGLIAFTGPATSGKTSSLYASLSHIAASPTPRRVVTVEEPVESILPGTTQVPVRPETGMTFSSALRAALRSNPDVVMVGEIRDLETLSLSLQAALTGHLVLITLHTTEAAAALRRMLDVGADPFAIADATRLIVAQRLVRVLCPTCSVARPPAEPFLTAARNLARLGGLPWDVLPSDYRSPVGCKECGMTGFRGRTVIGEAMEVTPRVTSALSGGATITDLRAVAVSEGMTTLAVDGIRRAAAGKTSLAEVIKTVTPIYAAELSRAAGMAQPINVTQR